jgi:hypothetical protein
MFGHGFHPPLWYSKIQELKKVKSVVKLDICGSQLIQVANTQQWNNKFGIVLI